MPLRNQLAHPELSDGESSRFGEAERVGAKTETSFRLNCNNKKSTLPIELGEWREYMFTKGGSKSFFFLKDWHQKVSSPIFATGHLEQHGSPHQDDASRRGWRRQEPACHRWKLQEADEGDTVGNTMIYDYLVANHRMNSNSQSIFGQFSF
jgi:hypothetical protein